MKKIIALVICIGMLVSAAVPTASAKQTADDMPGPVVFLTGIGQTFSYVLDENGKNTFAYLGENYKYNTKANILIFDMDKKDHFNGKIKDHIEANPKAKLNIAALLAQLVFSLFTGDYKIDYDRLCRFADDMLFLNFIDENGKLPDCILTPRYNFPLSKYSKAERNRFFTSVPCEEYIQDIGEERVYCFNYAPFGKMSNISKELDEYIENVVMRDYPGEKVTIIAMSMGAATVSRYLYDYCEGYKDKYQIDKVISVVGCWDGSDIVPDLIQTSYVENSAELFYNGIIGGLFGEPYGNLVNIVLHFFKKEVLSSLITDVLHAVRDEWILKTPTLLALIPTDRYDSIRNEYLTRPGYEDVLEEMDEYNSIQLTAEKRMLKMQENYGIDFYFISGYNLALGEGDPTFEAVKFLYSSDKVNSDGIINIESTTLGATSAPAHTQLSDEYLASVAEKKYISPDKSVDLSTALFPDRCWLFEGQKHELEQNPTALKIAIKIAEGELDSVNDDPENFPQFNKASNLAVLETEEEFFTKLQQEFINKYRRHNILGKNVSVEKGFENGYNDTIDESEDKNALNLSMIVKQGEALIEEYKAIKAETVNDPEKIKAFEEKAFSFLLDNGIIKREDLNDFYGKELTKSEKIMGWLFKSINDWVYYKCGPRGFADAIGDYLSGLKH